jgi:hypothetical protein
VIINHWISAYVFILLVDHMGQDESAPGADTIIKAPMGLLSYTLSSPTHDDIAWKITGNLSGESYADLTRGPRNEGALYAERQAFHLPGAPTDGWEKRRNPATQGVQRAGVGFFVTKFELNVPRGWDVPMSVVFGRQERNGTREERSESGYRIQLFVNGWQYEKFSEFIYDISMRGILANNS